MQEASKKHHTLARINMQEEFRQRRKTVMESIGSGTAVFRSAPVAVMHNDVEYAYRQDSDFYYLTGFNEPDAVAVLAPRHEKHHFILFVRPKDPGQETWTGNRAGIAGAIEQYGADEAYEIGELDQKLPQYLEKADSIYYHFGRDQAFNETIIRHWQKLLAALPGKGEGPTAIIDSGTILHPLRMVKSVFEIELMRQAAAISVEAPQAAWDIIRPGRHEYEIQAEIDYVFRRRGGDGPAYPSIVASGPNSCTLHYIDNTRQLQDQDVLVIDAGCAYHFYSADISRTLPVSGRFSPEQRTIYEIVLVAQRQAIAAIRPGRTYQDAFDAAIRTITEGLVDRGLLQGAVDDLIQGGAYKPFFMHRIGHWIGLDVHDCGRYRIGEASHCFEPGNVVTVEPGIYIGPATQPVEGQPAIDPRWRDIGVRIEDDVLVTADGNEVLTARLPKKLDEVENR